jgi:hypothetical protein
VLALEMPCNSSFPGIFFDAFAMKGSSCTIKVINVEM